MNTRTFATLSLCVLVALVCAAVAVAYAEIPAANPQPTEGVEHRWVRDRMAYAPYTEPADVENAAKATAGAALTAPPQSLIAQADHGYPGAQATIRLAESLAKAEPAVVGHEVIVWNEDEAARIYVGRGGDVRLLEVGPVQGMLVQRAAAASDESDREAVQVAVETFDVARGLDGHTLPATNGLVSAHAVGIADDDGSHLVARVGLDGGVTFPDW